MLVVLGVVIELISAGAQSRLTVAILPTCPTAGSGADRDGGRRRPTRCTSPDGIVSSPAGHDHSSGLSLQEAAADAQNFCLERRVLRSGGGGNRAEVLIDVGA